MGSAHIEAKYLERRRKMLEAGESCVYCGQLATELDHQPPLALHEHVGTGRGCCELFPSCSACARRQGGKLAGAAKHLAVQPKERDDHDGFGPTDPVWQVSWLADLLDVPEDASWPRLMTVPHARAVGSYGTEVELAALEMGFELRWWQKLAVRRMLEHDIDGQLVWLTLLISTSRQQGKGWLLRALAMWRIRQEGRWSGEQGVLHTGNNLAVAEEVQRPARSWAHGMGDGWSRREANGQREVRFAETRWLTKALESVYGHSAALAVVDECWDVDPKHVAEGIEPTLVERDSGQLLLTSTAHRRATSLMPGRRKTAIEQLGCPDDTLLLEWSAPPVSDLDDENVWRKASAHWSERRRKLMRQRLEQARNGEVIDPTDPTAGIEAFAAQWLNIWPARKAVRQAGEPLLRDVIEVEVVAPEWPAVFAVEDFFGQGSAVGWAGDAPSGRTVMGALTFPTRAEAYDFLSEHVLKIGVLMAGKSLAEDADLRAIIARIESAGVGETKTAFALLRDAVMQNRVSTDGSRALLEQLERCYVKPGLSGLVIVSKERTDALRAACWALLRHERDKGHTPLVW